MYPIEWTTQAYRDLKRVHDFLFRVNPLVAGEISNMLAVAPEKLADHPRIGERLAEFDPNEIRRLLVDNYEIRYEIYRDVIYVLKIWHTRENR